MATSKHKKPRKRRKKRVDRDPWLNRFMVQLVVNPKYDRFWSFVYSVYGLLFLIFILGNIH